MKNKMILLIIICVILIILAVYITYFYRIKVDTSNREVIGTQTSTSHYKNTNPSFTFDYLNFEGYKITTGSDYVKYDVFPPSKLLGEVGASISWSQIHMKVTADYWDKKKVNKNGIQYDLSEDKNILDFRLKNQGMVIRFNVRLPGSYLRKKEIINTIIDSFREGGSNGPLIIPPEESPISFFGKVIPENKQILHPEPYEGGIQMRAVVIPLRNTKYLIANFSWTLLPLHTENIRSESVYIYDNGLFTKIPEVLEFTSDGVVGDISINGSQHMKVNVMYSEFAVYNSIKAKDLLMKVLFEGFVLTK